MRRVWAGLLIAAVGGSGLAQQPPARPPAAPDVLLVQKTAGQPDRRLKLVKYLTGDGGERFVEVQDVASGAKYQLPAAALSGMTRAAEPPPVTKPAPLFSKFPTSLPVPESAGHSAFGHRPLPTTQPARPQPIRQAGGTVDAPLSSLVGGPAPADEPLTLPAPTRPVPQPMPAVLPASAPPPPAPVPTAPPKAVNARPAAVAARSEEGTVIGFVRRQLAPAKPTAPAQPVTPLFAGTHTGPTEVPPTLFPLRSPTTVVAARTPPPPAPMALAARPPAPLPPPPDEPVARVQFRSPAPADPMHAEIDEYLTDLQHALRPSGRERAATALANGRWASHPEVKQLLARVARTDPSPTVQAHCVGILSQLGYHAREYVEFLEEAAGSDHPALRAAASAAVARLAPR